MGETILGNRYEIIRKIGNGGMAFVYEAKDRLLNRTVALKVLRPEFVDDEEFLAKFKREAEAVASLSHPNIVNVYDVGEDGKVHYIVMEFIDGQNLKEIIQNEGTLDEYTSLDITKQICKALSAAHKKGIIHRDIKPHNILISNEGRIVKVADFGIAKAVSSSTVTNIGSVIGSVHYFSPEQAKGKFVTTSADLYSLGIVLYEMLLGKVPYKGDSPISIALQHINDEIEFTSEEKVKIPQSVRTIIKKLTEKSVSDRYQSAEEVIEDIDYVEKNIDLDFIKEYNDFETKKIDPEMINQENKSISDNNKIDPTPISDVDDESEDEDEEDDDYIEEYEKPKKKPKKNKKSRKEDSPRLKKILKIVAAILIIILLIQGFLAFKMFIAPSLKGNTSTAPNLVNMTVDQAKSDLNSLGVKLKIKSSQYNDSVPKDSIISQTPTAGTKIKKGDEIDVVVSKGQEKQTTPSLVGLTLTDAREQIEQAGFVLGEVKYTYSNNYNEGVVISQDPTSGSTELQKGASINLVVSKGSKSRKNNYPSENSNRSNTNNKNKDTDDNKSKDKDNSGSNNNNNNNNNNNSGGGNKPTPSGGGDKPTPSGGGDKPTPSGDDNGKDSGKDNGVNSDNSKN